jgi:uncharacterized phiE125 gp8 family phage protein
MLTRTTPPAVLITTTEAKKHLEVGHSDDDTFIDTLVLSVASYMDGYSGVLGQAMVSQVWEETFAAFSSPLRLTLGPVITVDSIQYWDSDNATQTLASSQYYLFRDALGPYVKLHSGNSWPSTYSRDDAITVTTTCGFGGASDVPDALKAAALLLVGHLYFNRDQVISEESYDLVMGFHDLIAPFRRIL